MNTSFTRAFLTHDLPLDVVHDVDGGLLGRGDHLLRVPAGAVLLLTSQPVSNVQTLLADSPCCPRRLFSASSAVSASWSRALHWPDLA